MFSNTAPIRFPPMRAGETDSRYIDCTLDLGAVFDTIPSASAVTITVTRQDGTPTTASDLAPATGHATTLDKTGLIVTFWLTAPLASANVNYIVTIQAATTQQRVFIRDAFLSVLALLG